MRVQTLEMSGFKKYIQKEVVRFGEITKISGANGRGKSTIAEAITYVLFGTDVFGNKLNPESLVEQMDVGVSIQAVDAQEREISLERRIENGKSKLLINEVPVKAGEFKDIVETYFTKEMFLTLFNPIFFTTQHWTAQREQFMRFIDEPLKEQVFSHAGPMVKKSLEGEMKKLDIDKLEAKYREVKKLTDGALIRLEERIQTYKKKSKSASGNPEQIERDIEETKDHINQLKAQIAKYEDNQSEYQVISKERSKVAKQLDSQAKLVNDLKAEDLLTVCKTCGQDLPDDKKEELQEKMNKRLEEEKEKGKNLVALRNELKSKDESFQFVSKPETEELSKLQETFMQLREDLAVATAQDHTEEIEQATAEYKEARDENVKSVDILDAIKKYQASRAAVMSQSINSLFGNLSVKLFKELANGKEESTFEILYDGMPYSSLSTAEKIKAGLELRNAFLKLLEENGEETAPVFIDNAESISDDITKFAEGQIITAAVNDGPLEIKAEGEVVA